MSRYKRLPGKQVLPGASAAAWTVLLFSLLMGALVFHWPADIIWQTRWRNSSQSDSDALIDWIRSNGGVVGASPAARVHCGVAVTSCGCSNVVIALRQHSRQYQAIAKQSNYRQQASRC